MNYHMPLGQGSSFIFVWRAIRDDVRIFGVKILSDGDMTLLILIT